ncbi:MAG: 2-nitropropane dioxygenase [Desulfuromonas sp.]|nr:MAG: 2-nitropropane dioxygenase [Desulfuromonas sp.]
MVYAQPSLGRWTPAVSTDEALADKKSLRDLLVTLRAPIIVTDRGATSTGTVCFDGSASDGYPVCAMVAPLPLEHCGDRQFCATHGVRYPMVGGSMAKGISSADIAIELGKNGMIGFFGSAGLPLELVDQTIQRLQQALPHGPFGVNLIHSPNEPDLENALVDLYIKRQVQLIEASAFLAMSLSVVRYRVHGIHRNDQGEIVTPNRIIAKISREEVARQFLSPPPQKMLDQLVNEGHISADQAVLAQQIPMAEDITAEADSGGHTDNRPALSLFPTICALRDELQARYAYPVRPRIGLAGGIATPLSAAAAIAMGAAYLVTGTVNQACCESGTSDLVRQMLAEARQADIAMAPAADMFEMGVDVQVLKRGTMFSMRAAKLYDLYRRYDSLDQIPADERDKLEKTFFRAPLNDVWTSTRAFFLKRDPRQVQRAEQDPKHLMALVFRSYLGQATHWANDGDESRRMDFQIWCGPSMGAFNEWVRGSFLEQPQQRRVACVNLNILFGAAVLTRANSLHQQGVAIDMNEILPTPLTTEQIKEYLRD